jgi:Protein of unknown function (DUF3225)
VSGVDLGDADAEAEVTLAFERYEAALVAHDTDTANLLFWDHPSTVRFGIHDAQVGHDAIARWRASQPPLPAGRTLSDTRVVALGREVVVVTTEFRYPGRPFLGRQSQVWLRTPGGWRIASAHVSEIPVS